MPHYILVTDDDTWAEIDPDTTNAFIAKLPDDLYEEVRNGEIFPSEVAYDRRALAVAYLDALPLSVEDESDLPVERRIAVNTDDEEPMHGGE